MPYLQRWPIFVFSTIIAIILSQISCQRLKTYSLSSQILSAQSYNTNQCGFQTKQQLLQKYSKYKPDLELQAKIKSNFPANRNLFIKSIITGNFGTFQQSIKGNTGKYFVQFGIIAMIAAVHAIIVPVCWFTKCCSCVRRKIQYFRKRDQEGYSPRELKWPSFCAILLLLAIIGISAAIIQTNRNFEPVYSDFKCSISVIAEDLLKGTQYKKQNIKFMGLENFKLILADFLNKISDLKQLTKTFLTKDSPALKNSRRYASSIFSTIKNFPNPNNAPLSLQYRKPLSSRRSQDRINSTFIDILGTPITQNSLVFNMTQNISKLLQIMNNLANQSQYFVINTSIVQSQSTVLLTSADNQIKNVKNIRDNIQQILHISQRGILKIYTIGIYVVIGILIGCSILMGIVVFLFGVQGFYGGKIGIYVCFWVLWVIGVLCYVMAFGYTVTSPGIAHGCQYLRQSTSSQDKFNELVTPYYSSFSSSSASKYSLQTISKCLQSPSSSFSSHNHLLQTIIPIPLQRNLSSLSNYYIQTNFDKQLDPTQLTQSYNRLLNQLQKYRNASILDLNDLSMIQQLRNLSKVQQCMGENKDSWVPSLRPDQQQQQQVAVIDCDINNMVKADGKTCSQRSTLQNRGIGCIGCMEISSILQNYQGAGDLSDSLQARYPNCSQTNFITDFSNIWLNFFWRRNQALTPLKQKLSQLQPYIFSCIRPLNSAIIPNFNTIKKQLKQQQFIKLHENEQSIIKNNMDCRIIGNGINISINILCSQGVKYVYNQRMLFIALAVILTVLLIFMEFILCCYAVQRNVQKRKKLENQIKENQEVFNTGHTEKYTNKKNNDNGQDKVNKIINKNQSNNDSKQNKADTERNFGDIALDSDEEKDENNNKIEDK